MLVMTFLAAAAGVTTAQTVRIDHTDPSVQYSGNWWSNSSASHSGGEAALSNTRGARATVTFKGRGITWIGMSDAWAGVATVYLDGSMQAIDTYSGIGRYQVPLFSVHGLADGTHTLSIEVLHERGPNTSGSWVWIDAFDIDNGTAIPGGTSAGVGRIEESHAALAFTGRWYHNASAVLSGGNAVLAMDAGSRVTIAFTGTGISWVGYRDEWSGVGNVYVDGQPKTTVDTYLSPSRAYQTLYSIGGLAPGTHSLTIEVTGTRNASAKGAWVWLDAFDIFP
jgi:hypothetical protein